MYEAFFGLSERPFDLTPNARLPFLTSGHRDALSTVEYGIEARKGMILLTGDAGVGKTTLLDAVLDAEWEHNVRALYLCHPTLSRAKFVEFLARSFELSSEARTSRIALVAELVPVLLRRHQAGGTTVLVLDEAHDLPYDLLQEVRLLANITSDTSRLLQVVLAGQPHLEARLHESSLRPLKPRVALRCHLKPLNARETEAFIADRVCLAGGDSARIFSDCAIRAIYEYSRGIPRTICAVCDNVLATAFAQHARSVRATAVDQVCRDVELALLTGDASTDEPPAGRRRRRTDAGIVRTEPAVMQARELEPVATAGRMLFATVSRPRRRFAFLSRRRERSSSAG